MRLADVHYRKPKEPLSKRLQSLKLVGDLQGRIDLARAFEEADELGDEFGVLSALLEVRLQLLQMLERARECLGVILLGKPGLVIGSGRRGGGRKRSRFSNEITELGLVFPGTHHLNDHPRSMHVLGPAPPAHQSRQPCNISSKKKGGR